MSMTIKADIAPLRVDNQGVIRVGTTRIPLDTLVACFHEGSTPEEIALNFNVLSLPDVYGALAYYLRHREELDRYLAEREGKADALQKEIEKKFPPAEIRERLLARRAAKA
ncbi:MAG: DUF433 domain-containing protein [Planctomycetota bacterium]|nr:DUF433 domain-containing protein [Planctomycetota bacterium]